MDPYPLSLKDEEFRVTKPLAEAKYRPEASDRNGGGEHAFSIYRSTA